MYVCLRFIFHCLKNIVKKVRNFITDYELFPNSIIGLFKIRSQVFVFVGDILNQIGMTTQHHVRFDSVGPPLGPYPYTCTVLNFDLIHSVISYSVTYNIHITERSLR